MRDERGRGRHRLRQTHPATETSGSDVREEADAAVAGDDPAARAGAAARIVIKSLFVQAFYIPSPSMEPQFVKNDRILVQKVSYWGGGSPSRGDIIVFEDPGGWLDADTHPRPSRR